MPISLEIAYKSQNFAQVSTILAAQELYYHRHCLTYALRSCQIQGDKRTGNEMRRDICDELLVLSVKSSLFIHEAPLQMNDINDEYKSLLKSYGLHGMYSDNHKKYLKELLTKKIPSFQFVKSIRKNESETVSSPCQVSEAMEFALSNSYSTSLDAISTVGMALREEALSYRDWKFDGSFSKFENPPLLQFFLNQLLFGRHSMVVTGKRDFERQKTLNVFCQYIVQNIRSDRQVKHKPKQDVGFRSYIRGDSIVGRFTTLHSYEVTRQRVD